MTYLLRLKKQALKLYQKKWLIPAAALSLVIILLAVFSVFVSNSVPETRRDIFAGRDFSRSPFELSDAYDLCYESIQVEHARDLLTSYMDDLSTYYDERKNTYLIVVDIQIGNGSKTMPGKVYCTINPARYKLTYYKEVIEGQGSFFARTVGFLSKVINK